MVSVETLNGVASKTTILYKLELERERLREERIKRLSLYTNALDRMETSGDSY